MSADFEVVEISIRLVQASDIVSCQRALRVIRLPSVLLTLFINFPLVYRRNILAFRSLLCWLLVPSVLNRAIERQWAARTRRLMVSRETS